MGCRGGHDYAECGCGGGAKNGNELTDPGEQSKDGAIRQTHEDKVKKYDKPRDDTHDKLTAYVDAQSVEQTVKEAQDAPA